MGKPNCYFCTHGYEDDDPSTGIWYHTECGYDFSEEEYGLLDAIEELCAGKTIDEAEKIYAERCGHYTPRMAESCSNCGNHMGIPIS